MKRSYLLIMAIAAGALIISCNGGKGDKGDMSSDSVSSVPEQSNPTNDSVNNSGTLNAEAGVEKDAGDFMRQAASSGLLEIEGGEIAMSKSSNRRIKDFGAMMIRDHTKAGKELADIAKKKHFTLPASLSPEDQAHLSMMQKMPAADFDSHYIKMMAEGHTKVAAMFEQATKNEKDTDIRDFAARTLPVIKMHLDSAKAISLKY